MVSQMVLPRVYPIADISTLQARGVDLAEFMRGLLDGGAEIVQLRDKHGEPQQVLHHAAILSEVLQGSRCLPVMNDRADLALLAGWRAVHVGHRDLPPDAVRRVFGDGYDVRVGVSTHGEQQVREAEAGSADYIAIGPVFATGTKADAEPVVGLEGVRRARELTGKPLVAIGGITRLNAASVIEAGADSVAVIGGLFVEDMTTAGAMRDFLERLR